MMGAKEWDERYAATELVWSAGPNQFVASLCSDLPPGRMIDLAAGEGRNALWFAANGWDATAVDYSAVAIDKARIAAGKRGVELTTVVADVTEFVPDGSYDLVLIAYLHIPPDQRRAVLERAVAAVAPGGRLLLIGHDATNLDDGYGGPSEPSVLTTPDEVVRALSDDFTVTVAEVADREVTTDDGPRTAKDTLVLAQRGRS